MTDLAALRALTDPDALFPAVEAALGDEIGHKLFTLMVLDRATDEAARIYSSDPESYPVKGRKPLGGLTEWGDTVLGRGEPYIGYTSEDIRKAFFDHELIASLGCASVLNVPVKDGATVIGTINLLHEAHWYGPDHAVQAAPYAELLVPAYLDWAAAGA